MRLAVKVLEISLIQVVVVIKKIQKKLLHRRVGSGITPALIYRHFLKGSLMALLELGMAFFGQLRSVTDLAKAGD